MRRPVGVALVFTAYWVSAPAQSAELSGPWKITTRGGPTPICSFVQEAGNLGGSCIGRQATGNLIGTIFGSTVRWRWQWLTYAQSSAAAFDFVATLQADDTMRGMLTRGETGLSLEFTAAKIAATVPSAQANRTEQAAAKGGTLPQQNAGSSAFPPADKGEELTAADRAAALMAAVPQPSDQELEQMSHRLFNPAGNYLVSADQEAKRQQWLYNAKQARIRNQIEIMKAGHD